MTQVRISFATVSKTVLRNTLKRYRITRAECRRRMELAGFENAGSFLMLFNPNSGFEYAHFE